MTSYDKKMKGIIHLVVSIDHLVRVGHQHLFYFNTVSLLAHIGKWFLPQTKLFLHGVQGSDLILRRGRLEEAIDFVVAGL